MMVKAGLEGERHVVETAFDGDEAVHLIKTEDYDVVVLDWQLPELSGIDVLKKIRQMSKPVSVIMLTGRSGIDHKEEGMDTGADDYLTKPFDTRELHARLRSLLRRGHSATSNVLSAKNITLDIDSREVTKDGAGIKLLPKEFALLQFLMLNPNKCFKPEALLDRVWQSDKAVTLSTVYTTLKTLRDKVSPGDDSLIENVHGVGYKLNH